MRKVICLLLLALVVFVGVSYAQENVILIGWDAEESS